MIKINEKIKEQLKKLAGYSVEGQEKRREILTEKFTRLYEKLKEQNIHSFVTDEMIEKEALSILFHRYSRYNIYQLNHILKVKV